MSKTPVNTLPDNVAALLEEADKKNGFPQGTMRSVLQQEVGGQVSKFLADPTAYHYDKNAEGKRIAAQSGKASTAFGPFGILESTGAKPGYGVAPLKNKGLEEQVRFASEYLAARSKQAGSLLAGLAGYGEGGKYAQQVAKRIGVQGDIPREVRQTAPAPMQAFQSAVPVNVPVDLAPVAMNAIPAQTQSYQDRVNQEMEAFIKLGTRANVSDAMMVEAQDQQQPVSMQEAPVSMGNQNQPMGNFNYVLPQAQLAQVQPLQPMQGFGSFGSFGSWGR